MLAEAEAEPSRFGMGTTAVVAVVLDAQAWVGHVGDSRCYLLPGAAQGACDALTAAALDAGGVDNVTTVVIDR